MPHKPFLSKKEYILYSLLGFLFIGTVISLVHEMGHGLYVLLFGGRVIEINIFPITLMTDGFWWGGYILWSGDFSDTEQLVINMAGSITTFIIGLILLFILIKYDLRPVFELWCWIYSLVLLFDLVFYILLDISNVSFNLFTDVVGDWEKVFEIWSSGKYVLGFMSVFLFISISFVFFHKKSKSYFNF